MAKWWRKLKRVFGGKRSRDILPDYVTIGRASYGVDRNTLQGLSPNAPVRIGNFCSFGPDVMIFCEADHPLHLPTSYPLRSKLLSPERADLDAVTKGGVSIGHDVWVGARAIILSGVTIANGAVIGAGAVVAKDVEPYAVVVGNPAQVVKRRFSDRQIQALQTICWWDWSDAKIRTFEGAFYGDIDGFIRAALAHKERL